MTDSLATTGAMANPQSLAHLRAAAREPTLETLREVASQFEAIFVEMVFKGMREARLADSPFEGEQSKLYRDMFDNQIAASLSKRGGIGIADVVARQLGQQLGIAVVEGKPPATQALAKSPREFVHTVWPYAEKAATELGTSPKALLAQAALETGWGKKVASNGDTSSYNLFGIKANNTWKGLRVSVPTVEYRDGVAVRSREEFRAYDSLADGFEDYVRLINGNPRYRAALDQAADPTSYVQALQLAGYATDPSYAQKITSVVNGDVLNEALREVGRTTEGWLGALE